MLYVAVYILHVTCLHVKGELLSCSSLNQFYKDNN